MSTCSEDGPLMDKERETPPKFAGRPDRKQAGTVSEQDQDCHKSTWVAFVKR
jgi:hypothetical protein